MKHEEAATNIDELDIKLPPKDEEGEKQDVQCHSTKELEDDQDLSGQIEAELSIHDDTVTSESEDARNVAPENTVQGTSDQLKIGQEEHTQITQGDDEALEELDILPEDVIRLAEPSAPPAAVAEVGDSGTGNLHNEMSIQEEANGHDVTIETSECNEAIVSAPPEEIVDDTLHETENTNRLQNVIGSEQITEHIQPVSEQQFTLPVEPVHEDRLQPECVRAMLPFSTDQLKSYYHNPMIDYQEDYVEHFVQVSHQ